MINTDEYLYIKLSCGERIRRDLYDREKDNPDFWSQIIKKRTLPLSDFCSRFNSAFG